MRFCVDVRIHAQRDGRFFAHFRRHRVQAVEFGNRFDVKAFDASRECLAHLVRMLADAGKHGVFRFAARGQHARQFAARHDVEAGAEACEHIQHREIAIGLDGDVHSRAAAGASACVGIPRFGERGARIDVQRRAELLGE